MSIYVYVVVGVAVSFYLGGCLGVCLGMFIKNNKYREELEASNNKIERLEWFNRNKN